MVACVEKQRTLPILHNRVCSIHQLPRHAHGGHAIRSPQAIDLICHGLAQPSAGEAAALVQTTGHGRVQRAILLAVRGGDVAALRGVLCAYVFVRVCVSGRTEKEREHKKTRNRRRVSVCVCMFTAGVPKTCAQYLPCLTKATPMCTLFERMFLRCPSLFIHPAMTPRRSIRRCKLSKTCT
jgi:hypothetical protein